MILIAYLNPNFSVLHDFHSLNVLSVPSTKYKTDRAVLC
jgi:hypothetical protein